MPEPHPAARAPASLTRRTFMRRGASAALLCAGTEATAHAARPCARVPVRTGYDRLAADGFHALKGRRVGLIANPTSVDRNLRHIADCLHDAPGVALTAIFGPEHGFRGAAQAGHSEGGTRDPQTGVPVFDIYARSGPRLDAILRASGVDLVVFDIQDIGARFYTYIWTMFDALVSCARCGISIIILDRPNPITGAPASGPTLDPGFSSFVGRVPLPIRHGMTVGELARYFNALHVPALSGREARLSVITMEGWRRDLYQDDTDLIWVPPSPNMPSVDTALAYPGTCLFEGTTLSVGRGTTSPFLTLGAPDWPAARWRDELEKAALPGCLFRDDWFTPGFDSDAGRLCHGLQLALTDRQKFDPLMTAITMLHTAIKISGTPLWSGNGRMFDLLAGSDTLRQQLARGVPPADIVSGWQASETAFNDKREKFLLYGDSPSGGHAL